MVDRRGFIASLLAAPLVGKVAAMSADSSAGRVFHGWTDDGKMVTTIYNDRMWFTSREGVHVYYGDARDDAFAKEWAEGVERDMFSGKA